MEPAAPQSISTLLKKYDLHPRKGLGQNFLIDPFHLDRIVGAAGLTEEDTVLEIGPGPGTLTRLLAEAAGRVIAVELDSDMVNLLRHEFGHLPNLTIIEGDILQTGLDTLVTDRLAKPSGATFKVVANLPYYITSAVLRHVLDTPFRPGRVVVTVQLEVAQRLVAKPGKMSLLAVSVQFYGTPALVHRIPAGAFYPPPRVDSAVVRIDTFSEPPLTVSNEDHFFRIVKAGFGQKRKQLKNSLAAGLHKSVSEIVSAMAAVDIDPARRAETMGLEEWSRLAEAIRL